MTAERIALTPAEEEIKDKGLILILKELHERLDTLVFEAYGWPDTLTDEQILRRRRQDIQAFAAQPDVRPALTPTLSRRKGVHARLRRAMRERSAPSKREERLTALISMQSLL
jgi:hypothetical protein